MKGAGWALVGILAVGLPVLALGIEGSAGLGVVGMTYLNGQLEALAGRQGTTFSPLLFAWEAALDVWPWPFIGIRGDWLGSSGGIGGRDPQPLSATAVGLGAYGRLALPLFAWQVGIRAGVGGYWVSASGVVAGHGLALGGHVAAELVLLGWGPIQGSVSVALRYLPVQSIRNERETINPRQVPALDFSGLYIGVTVGWR